MYIITILARYHMHNMSWYLLEQFGSQYDRGSHVLWMVKVQEPGLQSFGFAMVFLYVFPRVNSSGAMLFGPRFSSLRYTIDIYGASELYYFHVIMIILGIPEVNTP